MFPESQDNLPSRPPLATDMHASAAVVTPASGKLLKRAEAARVLGVSVSTLRRREGELLRPIVGPDGVHMFDEAQVRAVTVTLRGRATLAAMGPSAGDTAADVFTLLDDGVHPVEIVKRLRLTPDVVVALQDQWSRMRGGFTVGPDQAAVLGRLARSRVPTTAAVAVAALRARVETLLRMRQGSASCWACGHQTASICEACVVRNRGPLSTMALVLEERIADDGNEELRLRAEAYWDDVGDEGGNVTAMHSDWHRASEVDASPISDIVAALRARAKGEQR